MVNLLLAIIYLAFISLGLPDSLLGAAWPSMYGELNVPVSYAGAISMIIAAGTVVSSLQSDRLTKNLGAGRVTVISVGMTAASLIGFCLAKHFWMLCILAVPYGLGAGSVDAALNNYVAIHYKSRHMSWLHCMWGLGASLGPYIMGQALSAGNGWRAGYRYIGIFQILLTLILLISLPLWRNRDRGADIKGDNKRPLTLRQIVGMSGAKEIMVCFFCYCALEQTVILWGSSYLAIYRGMGQEIAASFASVFFLGITIGRAACGFITLKLSDKQMIRLGQAVILAGCIFLLLPGQYLSVAGLALLGLGCAPIYPCIIHSTPANFGAENSQGIMGVQMASAYVGTCLMPPLFGALSNVVSIGVMPIFLLLILAAMVLTYSLMLRRRRKSM